MMNATPQKPGAALILDMSPTVWTSVDQFHFQLCSELTCRGLAPVVIFAAQPPAAYAHRMASSGAVIVVLNHAMSKYRYFGAMGKVIRNYNISIIQSRGFNYFTWLWWIARLHQVKRILFVEGNSGLLRARSWKKQLLGMRAAFMTVPVTRTITVSRFVKSQLLELGFKPDRVLPIHNGIDLSRFHPDSDARESWRAQYGVGPGELIISTISYLRDYKQPHIVLEACALLLKRGVPIRLFIAGDGPLMGAMRSLGEQLGLTDHIYWLGNFPEAERLLQASDVFVLSSVGEAIGNVLIEAMGCGVPCVGSDSGGIPEVIDDGNTGYLARPLDPADFADRIQAIASDPQVRCRMAQNSLE